MQSSVADSTISFEMFIIAKVYVMYAVSYNYSSFTMVIKSNVVRNY